MFRRPFTSFFSSLTGRALSRRRFTTKVRRPRGFRPRIEPLEDRRLLAVALVEDVKPGEESSFPEPVGVVDDSLYYFANDPTHGRSLWRADAGTSGATFLKETGFFYGSAYVDDTLFIAHSGVGNSLEIWKADSESRSPSLVTTLPSSGRRVHDLPMVAMNGVLFLLNIPNGRTAQLWKTDGTPQGTEMIREVEPPRQSSSDDGLEIASNGDVVFFVAGGGSGRQALWKSDGAAAGTTIVHEAVDEIDNFTLLDDTLYYTVSTGFRVGTLWRSDGTKQGTRPIKENVSISSGHSASAWVVNVNGELFFAADDGVHGVELWKSDGTVEGTVMVRDVNPGGGGSTPNEFTNVDGTLFFVAQDGDEGRQLWRSDGTAAGTRRLIEFPKASEWSPIRDLFAAGQTIFFSFDGKLWRTDGTPAETGPVAGFPPLPHIYRYRYSVYRPIYTNVKGTVYFISGEAVHGVELWKIFRHPGDTNYDDRVDLTDLNNVRNGFGRSGDSPRGDANGDGVVDLVDLNLVRNGFEPVRPRPLPAEDAYQAEEDEVLVVNAAEGLLANDAVEPGRTLQAIIHERPRHGTVQIEPDGSFRYRSDRDFFGTDSFRYVALAGSGPPSQLVDISRSWPTTVYITVSPVNDAPSLGDFSAEMIAGEVYDSRRIPPTNEAEPNDSLGAAQRIDAYFTRDLDPDITDSTTIPHATILGRGDGTKDFYRFQVPFSQSTVQLTFDIDTAPGESLDTYLRLYTADGVLLRDADDSPIESGAGGSHSTRDAFLFYYFDSRFDPTVEFILEVGSCCVGPVPSGAEYRLHVSIPGHALASPTALAGAFDVDGDVLTAVLVDDVLHGELIFVENGNFTYTPAFGFVGVDSFTYRVSDGMLESNLATVTITVHPAPARVLDRLQGASRSFVRKTALAVESNAVWDQALAELAPLPS